MGILLAPPARAAELLEWEPTYVIPRDIAFNAADAEILTNVGVAPGVRFGLSELVHHNSSEHAAPHPTASLRCVYSILTVKRITLQPTNTISHRSPDGSEENKSPSFPLPNSKQKTLPFRLIIEYDAIKDCYLTFYLYVLSPSSTTRGNRGSNRPAKIIERSAYQSPVLPCAAGKEMVLDTETMGVTVTSDQIPGYIHVNKYVSPLISDIALVISHETENAIEQVQSHTTVRTSADIANKHYSLGSSDPSRPVVQSMGNEGAVMQGGALTSPIGALVRTFSSMYQRPDGAGRNHHNTIHPHPLAGSESSVSSGQHKTTSLYRATTRSSDPLTRSHQLREYVDKEVYFCQLSRASVKAFQEQYRRKLQLIRDAQEKNRKTTPLKENRKGKAIEDRLFSVSPDWAMIVNTESRRPTGDGPGPSYTLLEQSNASKSPVEDDRLLTVRAEDGHTLGALVEGRPQQEIDDSEGGKLNRRHRDGRDRKSRHHRHRRRKDKDSSDENRMDPGIQGSPSIFNSKDMQNLDQTDEDKVESTKLGPIIVDVVKHRYILRNGSNFVGQPVYGLPQVGDKSDEKEILIENSQSKSTSLSLPDTNTHPGDDSRGRRFNADSKETKRSDERPDAASLVVTDYDDQAVPVPFDANSVGSSSRSRGGSSKRSAAIAPAPIETRSPGTTSGVTMPQPVINEDDRGECMICLSSIRDSILFPCRHSAMCVECALVCVKESKKCPVCREPIKLIIQVL
eukprot:gene9936-10986_t